MSLRATREAGSEAISCFMEWLQVRGDCFVGESALLATTYVTEIYMAIDKKYCVYIMTNAYNTVLYTGVTNNLARRVYEHKNGLGSAFVKKYNVHKLVYYEIGNDARATIAREKQVKGGSRKKKIDLINGLNPEWKDLYEEIK
jgi:putative endonuclease